MRLLTSDVPRYCCRELFRLPEDVDISLTFGCKEPMSGTHLKLEGMGAFDAAVHCASVAAAERQQKIKKSHSTGNLGSHIAANNTAAGSNGGSGRNVNRSASSTQISASSVVSHATAASPPPLAAGSPSAPAVAGRRQRFHGQQQQQQPTGGQMQPPWSRSRSLSHIKGKLERYFQLKSGQCWVVWSCGTAKLQCLNCPCAVFFTFCLSWPGSSQAVRKPVGLFVDERLGLNLSEGSSPAGLEEVKSSLIQASVVAVQTLFNVLYYTAVCDDVFVVCGDSTTGVFGPKSVQAVQSGQYNHRVIPVWLRQSSE